MVYCRPALLKAGDYLVSHEIAVEGGIIIGVIIFYRRLNTQRAQNLGLVKKRVQELREEVNNERKPKTSSLTDDHAYALLEKLKALEIKELYLRPDYSLNLVARTLGTNTTYLSKTVNEYMGVSFTEYSNKLKVNGIVNKLNKHRHYRNYTIDALAKEAGYKSVNAYNTNFKKILKVSPSQYLKELNESEKD